MRQQSRWILTAVLHSRYAGDRIDIQAGTEVIRIRETKGKIHRAVLRNPAGQPKAEARQFGGLKGFDALAKLLRRESAAGKPCGDLLKIAGHLSTKIR
jgi:hypothetical protein